MDNGEDREIIKRRDFIVDVVEIATYLGEQNDATLSARFINAVDSTINDIVDMPGIGSFRTYDSSEFGKLRAQQVRGFRVYLVFYTSTANEIIFLRLIHGARDLDAIFGEQ